MDLPRDLGVAGVARRNEASPVVEYAEPNVLIYASVTPNDPGYGKLWGLHNTGQTVGDADIDAPEAWN